MNASTGSSEIRNLVEKFLDQTNTEWLKTSGYIKSYQNLKVTISFGKGAAARVPWIAFLVKEQRPSEGIYPVILYFKAFRLLILAYGVSEYISPSKTWNLPPETKTIGQYLSEKNLIPPRYNKCYVYREYNPDAIDWDLLESDVHEIIREYRSQLGK